MRKRSYLTVRNLPEDVARELEHERKRRGDSLNRVVINSLRRGLGLGQPRKSNGLAALAKQWTKREFDAFERHLREIGESIDEDVWR